MTIYPHYRVLFLLVVFCITLLSEAALAERYTPTNENMVIAKWPVVTSPDLQRAQIAKRSQPNDPILIVNLANHYLSLANLPGQSRYYGLAQSTLRPAITANTDNAHIWLAWAQVLQHQHAFDESLNAIAKVLIQDPKNVTANLLAARIYLIQDKPAKARQACLALLGVSELLTTSGCVLEVTGQKSEELAESYKQLEALVSREGLPNDQRGFWLAQVLADMAVRLERYADAETWMKTQLSNNPSVNYLAQWAEIQILQGKDENVISYLTPIVNSAPEIDDTLLLQLALAEKSLLIKSGDKKFDNIWGKKLSERVNLREQRQDIQHANEVARFYLDIQSQPEKALHWATLHTQHSREINDKKLLERAKNSVSYSRNLQKKETR